MFVGNKVPDIIKIFHTAVSKIKAHHCLVLFGNGTFERVGVQFWPLTIKQNRIFYQQRFRTYYIAKSNIYLHKDAGHSEVPFKGYSYTLIYLTFPDIFC